MPETIAVPDLYSCQSGLHHWSTPHDAHCCCNPKYCRKHLIVKNQTGFGITYLGFSWMAIPEPEPQRKPR